MRNLFSFLVVLLVVTFVNGTSYAQITGKKLVINIDLPELKIPENMHPYIESDEEDDDMEDSIADDLASESGGMHGIPAADIYSVWDNNRVNPYNPGTFLDSAALSMSGFNFPLKTFYRVNSEFGQRRRRYHYGIDLKIERGDTVVSSFDGMVRIAKAVKSRTGYGKYVVIRHYNGLETVYGHLDEVLVEPDQLVKSGQLIGLAGNTGRSTGPHLHYELRYEGRPINPRDIIDFSDDVLAVKSDSLLLTATHFVYPRKSTRTVASTKKKTSTAPAKYTASHSSRGTWIVKSGDTLGRIAQQTNTSLNLLYQLNGLGKRTILKIGQKIHY